MDANKLKEVLEKHGRYLRGEEEGERANLSGADLRGADLYRAKLCGAVLYRADLRGANLYSADLRGANLRSADLSGADLRGADLYRADLSTQPKIMQFAVGNKHHAFLFGDVLTIGCHAHTLEHWIANYVDIGRIEGYTERDIKMYGKLIQLASEFSKAD